MVYVVVILVCRGLFSCVVFFFKQKTAYEMRISDWSSDVCSSDLDGVRVNAIAPGNILFEGGDWEARVAERPDAWGRWIKREVALRRFGKVEEIEIGRASCRERVCQYV